MKENLFRRLMKRLSQNRQHFISFVFSLNFVAITILSTAQKAYTFFLKDSVSGNAIQSVNVTNESGLVKQTNTMGFVTFAETPSMKFTFSCVGYEMKELSFVFPLPADTMIIRLTATENSMEEVVIVSTRTNQPIEHAPIKIEILDAEEMQEESAVKPTTVLGIVGDASGIQVQQSSAVSCNANIRIQGLEGRYTQILRDGLPLYDGFSGRFDLLSIPPLDLKQVELIKGSASTLYGGGAIGGLINLISKKPSYEGDHLVTINQTTLEETNFNSFFSKRKNKWGYSLYAGYTAAKAKDVDGDGFSDVSKVKSSVIHPRIFWYPNATTTLMVGYTSIRETRTGGDMLTIDGIKDTNRPFFETNGISRNSGELSVEKKISDKNQFFIKTSVSEFERIVTTNTHLFKGNQLDYYNEISLVTYGLKSNWVNGFNVTGNRFRILGGDPVLIGNINNNTIGLFTQYNFTRGKWTNEAGLRSDFHNRYGNFLLPRLASFYQINANWGARIGWGMGYKIPDALSPQIREYEIEDIKPIAVGTQAEISSGYNAEINFKKKWDADHSLFINHAFFLTSIYQPLVGTEDANGKLSFANASKPVVTRGFDTYLKLKLEDWEIYTGLTYTLAERTYLTTNKLMPLTPIFRTAGMITYEIEGKARLCVESSYTGMQTREDYSKTPGYLFIAAMADVRLYKFANLIINCENLLDYRQTKIENINTGTISNPVFRSLWAPIDGRVVNVCLRVHF